MPQIIKNKPKSTQRSKTLSQRSKSTPHSKKVKKNKLALKKSPALKKPRSVHSKENTLAYYNCLLEQVANNDKVKITKLCNWCRGNKAKVAWAKSESKRELVEKVAKSYLEFGKGLGHLLHADVVSKDCKCK